MKKSAVYAVALALGLAMPAAQAEEVSVTADVTFVSQYIFRGIELANNAIQPSVELTYQDFYAGIWGSYPIDKKRSGGWEREVNLYLGYGADLGGAEFDIGVTRYMYPNDSDTMEFYTGLMLDFAGVTPGVYLFYDWDLKTWTLQGSIGYSAPLEELGTSIDLTATLGRVMPRGDEYYLYYGVGAAIPYQINDNLAVSVSVNFDTHNLSGVERRHLWWGASVTFGF